MAARVPSSSPLSSLQSSEATFRTASPELSPRFQSTQLLPFELQQYLQTYLEESLFTQAFRFLLSLASASANNQKKKVLVPSAEYLATIATITVHPRMTTRAEGKEQQGQSNLALQLLNAILKTTGPINSHLIEAYQFRNFVPSDDESGDWRDVKLNLIYADSQNVFKSKDDFWAVLGWALNCSCLSNMYQERWDYWKPWLEHVLDVLEVDWDLREEVTCKESLIWQYISTATGGSAAPRRILRSIFADGTTKPLAEFDQVFPRELKERREKQENKKPKVAVNIDEEIYGDWMQDQESTSEEDNKVIKTEGVERSSKRLRNRTPGVKQRMHYRIGKGVPIESDDSEASGFEDEPKPYNLGPPASIVIRLRLLELLVAIASQTELSPTFLDLHDLYTLFVEFTRPLPLPVFERITMLSKGTSGLKPTTVLTLCEFLLQRIVDNEGHGLQRTTLDAMTPERLIAEYLPFTASYNNIEMQAKMSLLIESVLRTLLDTIKDQDLLQHLSEALNTGIQKRQSKAEGIRNGPKYKKGLKGSEDEAFSVLSESSMRMTFVMMQALRGQ